jgi:hypothetical protein
MATLSALVMGGVGIFVLWRLPYWLEASTRRIEAAREQTSEFYEAAGALVSDHETPEEVLSVLEWLSNHIRDAAIIRTFVTEALLGRLRGHIEKPSPFTNLLLARIREMRPEMQNAFGRAVAHAMLAMSFRGGLAGAVMRNIMFLDIAEKGAASKLVSDYMVRERHAAAA